jgi:uncharacterized protein
VIQDSRNVQNSEGKRKTGRRGFAAMDPEKQREIARAGGKAAHQKGRAHEFSSDEAREAGRKGGQAVSQNREHMSRIGAKGGRASRGRRSATPTPQQEQAERVRGNSEVSNGEES